MNLTKQGEDLMLQNDTKLNGTQEEELLLYSSLEDITDDFWQALERRGDGSCKIKSVFMRVIEFGEDSISKDEDTANAVLVSAYFEALHTFNVVPKEIMDKLLSDCSIYLEENIKKYNIYVLYAGFATNDELRKSIKLMIESTHNEKRES